VATSQGDGLAFVDGAQATVTGGSACYLEPVDADTAVVHVYSGAGGVGHVEYVLDLETAALDDASITALCDSGGSSCDASDGLALVDVNQRGALTVFGGSDNSNSTAMGVTIWNGGSLLGEYMTTHEVLSADAWMHGGTLYVVIVRDNGGMSRSVLLGYGDPAASLSEVDLSFAHPTLSVDASGASIFVDDDRILIGVSAKGTGGDALGWSFMGHAP
jgi:hypothetical protein